MTAGQLQKKRSKIMSIKKRARKDEEKQARRQAILDTAAELLEAEPYEAISISQIAKQAGIAKGTIYLYFNTKEHLFLALLEDYFEEWFTAVNASLKSGTQQLDAQSAAFIINGSIRNRPVMARLFAIAHVILERNIDKESARAYKLMLRENVLDTGTLLEKRLPFLNRGEGAELLMKIYAVVIGVQHIARPAPTILEVIEEAPQELGLFKVQFDSMFQQMLLAQIRAYENR